MATFSEKIKQLRIEKRLTLRDFCSKVGLDASNWSKVERGINPPPGDLDTLERIGQFLDLQKEQKTDLFDLAATARKELPVDLADDAILLEALPAFFRAARGHQLTPEKIQEFAQEVLKLNKPDDKGN
jgi:transcriptional regulator with XRE-family HTH domain